MLLLARRYLSILVNKICRVESSKYESLIAAQLVAVVIRVPPVQKLAVQMLLPILEACQPESLENNSGFAHADTSHHASHTQYYSTSTCSGLRLIQTNRQIFNVDLSSCCDSSRGLGCVGI